MVRFRTLTAITLATFLIVSCQSPKLSSFSASSVFSSVAGSVGGESRLVSNEPGPTPLMVEMDAIVKSDVFSGSLEGDFKSIINSAVERDPMVITARKNLSAKHSAVKVTEAAKDFQIGGTVYGGVEDVSDETVGVAVVLDANRVVYDGGKLDLKIIASEIVAESARHELTSQINERVKILGGIWVDLERI